MSDAQGVFCIQSGHGGFIMRVLLFAAAAVAADASVIGILPPQDVFDDARSIAICVIGSLMGAFITIAAFPPKDDTEDNKTRRLSLKFGASMLSGVAFSAGVMDRIGVDKTPDNLMAVSSIVAVFAVSSLHMMVPRIELLIKRHTEPK